MNILYAFAHHMRIIFAHAHVRILCARTLRLRSCRLKARRLRSCSHSYIGGRRKLPQAEEVRRPLGGAWRVHARWVRPKVEYGRLPLPATASAAPRYKNASMNEGVLP